MKLTALRYFLKLANSPANRRRMLLSLFISGIQALLVLSVAWLIRLFFANIIPNANSTLIILSGILVTLLYLLSGLGNLLVRRLMGLILREQIENLRLSLLNELLAAPRSMFTEADWGRLQSILVWDTERVHRMGEALAANLTTAALLSVALSTFLFMLNPPMFAVMAGVFPLLFLIARLGTGKVHQLSRKHHKGMQKFNRGMLTSIQRLELTHTQTAEAQEFQQQSAAIHDIGRLAESLSLAKTAQTLRQQNILLVIGVVVLVAGGMQVSQGKLELGDLITFYAGVALLRPALQTLTSAILPVIEGYTSLLSIYTLHTSFPPSPYSGAQSPDLSGEICFENVCFTYDEQPVLRNLTLKLRPGELNVISGENGSGKTTLVHLLMGFYRPQKGRVLVSNQPLELLDIQALRRQIGIVSQAPQLFPGTILDNLTYGLDTISLSEVNDAARLAEAEEFIKALPQGYETPVGEQGTLLSGGQRQRIALARALLRRPRLLILDEPTNHLDEVTARRFIQGLQSLPGAPTILLITHRSDLLPDDGFHFHLHAGNLVDERPVASATNAASTLALPTIPSS